MKHAVNAQYRTGLFRIFTALLLLLVFWPGAGLAASVRFEVLPDRERLTIALNKEEGFAGEVSRVARQGLLLNLGVPTLGMVQDLAPPKAVLFNYTEPRGRALGIFMKTAAFGYVVTRPDNFTVVITAYPDKLGEQWRSKEEEAAAREAEASSPDKPSLPRNVQLPTVTPHGEKPAPREKEGGPVRGVLSKQPGKVTEAVPSNGLGLHDLEYTSGTGGGVVSGTPERVVGMYNPLIFRSKINEGDVDEWEKIHPDQRNLFSRDQSLSGRLGQEAAKTAPTEPAPAGEAAAAVKTAAPEKAALDEKGNPIPPPPSPHEILATVRKEITSGNYKAALEALQPLLNHAALSAEQKEEALHLNAEMLFMANQNALAANYDAIVSSSLAAMNYNAKSPSNAAVYLRLGYLNLMVGNLVEADAYFTRLRRQYPHDENVPLTYYYWGRYYYDKGDMQRAADELQYIIRNYAESRYARDAALGLAQAYAAIGYNQEAYGIIEYIERRWPRLYLESPSILELMGDVGYRQGMLDFALDKYMLHYNLLPDGASADVILTRIGDVYARKHMLRAARLAYEEAERRFPGKDGGLVAIMRLAEMGIHDRPRIQEMLDVFKGQKGIDSIKATTVYNKIINEHPESELVPLAMLKLAMWNLAQTRYEDALALCSDLVKRFPTHELAARAEEVAMRAFDFLAAEGAAQNRAGKVVANWHDNPILGKQEESLSPRSRVALALSMYKQQDPDGALETVSPMFLGRKDPAWGEQALQLALAVNLDHDRWEAVEKLANQVSVWELTEKAKLQLDYALALSRENLGKSEEAAPLWRRLAQTGGLNEKEQAYAEYFLAREAESKRNLQEAYSFGSSALNRFLALAQRNPAEADTPKINSLLSSLIDICETSGRLDEALAHAERYMASLPENDSRRQGMLFRMAGIYKKQGKTDEWRNSLTELSQKYPESVHGRAAASTLRSSQLSDGAAQFAPQGGL